jgi:hypothetical protein
VKVTESADKLTAVEREQVEAMRATLPTPGSTKAALVDIIDRLAPKPATKAKTAQELAKIAREGRGGKYDAALAELVRRANGGKP